MNEEVERAFTESMNRLRGRLLGALESFGLPERQETAAKQIVKSLSYDIEKEVKELLQSQQR